MLQSEHHRAVKTGRLKRRTDISRIYRHGRQWNGSRFRVIWMQNSLDRDRCAILVSRRHGNAVRRNRIKRVFRALVRKHDIINPPFYDILLLPATGKNVSFRENEKEYLTWREIRETSRVH